MNDNDRNTTNITRLLCYQGRERERKKKYYFALLMAQNASNEKLGFWPVGKKSKVSCLARNRSIGVKQVVFYKILFD